MEVLEQKKIFINAKRRKGWYISKENEGLSGGISPKHGSYRAHEFRDI